MVSDCMHMPMFPLEFKKQVHTGNLNATTNQLLTAIIQISDHLHIWTFWIYIKGPKHPFGCYWKPCGWLLCQI